MRSTTALSFDVLGPVRGHYRGRAIELGPARQSALLGVMLTRPNMALSSDELLHWVWGDQVPKSTHKVIPTYIYRLRQALQMAGDEAVIERVRNGYALRIEADAVDAARFARATESMNATRMMSSDDQYGHVASVLEMWRGEPFEGLPGPALASERAKLHEMRLTLLMRRAGLDIVSGNHAAAVLDLLDLQERNPMHEQVACLLMTALYQSGRQAESLAVYSKIRLRLLHELGSEPGRALVTTHRAVLTGDQDALDRICGCPMTAAPGKTVTEVPVHTPRCDLPGEAGLLLGRDFELAALAGAIRAGRGSRQVIAVDGMPGIGKTAFALRLARMVATDYPDGQLYVDLRGHSTQQPPLSTSDALWSLLASVGVPPARPIGDVEQAAALLRATIADRRLLILLDDVIGTDQILPLLPGGAASAVLAVSRNKLLALPATRTLSLYPLEQQDSRALLGSHIGPERLAADEEGVTQLVQACAGHPLALALVGARLRHRPMISASTLARHLVSAPDGFLGLRAESASLLANLEPSLSRLDAEAHKVLGACAVADRLSATRNVLASRLDMGVGAVEASLDQLVDRNLLMQVGTDQFRLHPVVAGCVRALLPSANSP
ncbi:AfsR/SARP family transcriptional regulator [Kibdelosporangium persicum]|uniref:AfsR/SARP family transcriptional regulator n=1 Tax=Kibdelosporangium persicum TaxID=2698649 RepID=UPI0015647149|nr:AfsR/SARP family transcriptional regulator [Kibdelosporangium persicum]